jgi:signal transduction histidine kinase
MTFVSRTGPVEEFHVADRTTQDSVTAAEAEGRYRAMFSALREPVLMTSVDGRISGFNGAARSLFGHSAHLAGRPITELLPFVVLGDGGAEQPTWEGSVVDATDHTLVVEVSRTRLDDANLPIIDVYIVHDVSRYVELNRLREQLLLGLAHELRSPLAVLDNSLAILATEYGDLSMNELDQMLGSARRSVEGLRDLMEDLLSAGSIQSGRLRVYPRSTELRAIVDDALVAVGPIVETRQQRIECDIAADVPNVLVDRRYGRKVLAQLLRNASAYSPAGELIRVRAERADGQVCVTVEDRGPGIPAEQQAGLFERFYRVRAGYDEPGIGLGLAITKGIIEAHGGSIRVDSQVGVGTIVWFSLPEAKEPGP